MNNASLLESFQKYLNTAEEFDDLEIVTNYAWLRTASTEQKAALIPIAQRHNHSLLALWTVPGSDQQPVVWLDSEGADGIVANSFQEFLSISPYGLGNVKDIMRCFGDGRSADRIESLLKLKFPPGELDARLEEHQEEFEGSKAYQQWLAETCSINIASDPISIIKQANSNHPDFEQWLAKST